MEHVTCQRPYWWAIYFSHICLLFQVITTDELGELSSGGQEEFSVKLTENLPFVVSGSLPEQNSLVELGALVR